ncbi:MAG: class I SAM-dependent methyltransferase [Asticcacaulis sp.]|nr:class I SAM-dependent methyltransferase [Asticcacaulis sp.]
MEKTIAMLANIKPGTYLPDGVPCFDESELAQLAATLKWLIYAPSSLRRELQREGVTVTRADFYSEVPTVEELEASFAKPSKLKLDKVFPDPVFLKTFLAELAAFADEFKAPRMSEDPAVYSWEGGAFGFSDAMAYYCMIRLKKPKTIIEIGSGASTLVARHAVAKNGFGRIIAVEPYPLDYLPSLADVELVRERAQDLDSGFFNERLEDGDMLFIDSTHTVKHDSDVLHIYLRILPEIRRAITVHAHDIYMPGPLPINMLREQQVYWNEQYLLYAYMLGNPRIRTLFGSRYHMTYNHGLLSAFMRDQQVPGGASFWFEQAPAAGMNLS